MISLRQLHHFWLAAHHGTIQRAAEIGGFAPQTVSAQIAALEAALGKTLFTREGRQMVLTAAGETLLRYADEIFHLIEALEQELQSEQPTLRLRVGLLDSVPKAIAAQLLAPLRALPQPVVLHVTEERFAQLIAGLISGSLDLVLSDVAPSEESALRLVSHRLLEAPLAWFGARRWGPGPITWATLAQVPLLLPAAPTHARIALLAACQTHGITPRIAGEFADTALLIEMAEAGDGIFPAPQTLTLTLTERHRLVVLGEIPEIHERYWLIYPRRKEQHPAIRALRAGLSQESQ